MSKNPKFSKRVKDEINKYFILNISSYKQKVQSLIEMELAYTNTQHEDYVTNMANTEQ